MQICNCGECVDGQKPGHMMWMNFPDFLKHTKSYLYYPRNVELSSGRTSTEYFDVKKMMGEPAALHVLASMMYESICCIPGIKSVGGVESGGIALAHAISYLSFNEHLRYKSRYLKSFWVRRHPKARGTMKRIEGMPVSPSIIVDDVITTGMTSLDAIRAVRKEGIECKHLMTPIFRGNKKDEEIIRNNVKFSYMYDAEELRKRYDL